MKRNRPPRAEIAAFCGIFRQPPGAKSVLAEHLEGRAEERRREEAKWDRCFGKPTAKRRSG